MKQLFIGLVFAAGIAFAGKEIEYFNLHVACTAAQGTSTTIGINRDMTWTVDISKLPVDVTISKTDWYLSPEGITETKLGPGSNVFHKMYTTVGLKTITGTVFAHNADYSKLYTLTCTGNNGNPIIVQWGSGSIGEN